MPTETLMMKDSGIDCIAEIPENWDISRIKYDATFYNGDRSEEYPSGNDIIDEGIPFVNSENIHGTFLDVSSCKCITNEKYKRLGGAKLKINDIVFCLRGSVGNCSINKSINEGTVASSLVAIRANNINPDFLNYYLNSDSTVFQTSLFQNGSCAANLSAEKVSNYYICTPILKEQQAIAVFLDEKCEKIDKVIGEIEEQIQVLEDYKKSLITETVTKGLDKNVPMKNSGIDWIGQIPKDWNIKRIKYFTNLNGRIGWQGLTTEDYQDEGPFLITGVDFLNGSIDWSSCTHITEKRWLEANTIQIKNDDLLITKDGTVGKVAVVSGLNDKASLNSGVLLIRPQGNVEYYNRYIYYQLISDVFWSWFEFNKSGNSTIIHLYQQDFANLYTLLPNITEQKQIADYLDKECKKIDKTISDKKEQLETIKEYKKSLIYEYVTGKKRVAC